LIGNAHLDPVWLWRWQEGYAEALATFRSALDRLSEFDGFIFTCSSAAYYAWVEETDPAMFEEIRQRVAQGRWIPVGGWWVQPDCNAPSGESFARHALYSQRFFMSRFGRYATVGYNVDSFGHNAMLPQLLRLSGMRGYVMMRPDAQDEKRYPFPENVFMWRSPDGSSVPVFRIPNGYGSGPFGQAAEKAVETLGLAESAGRPMMCFYGVGNHGGGPTIQNVSELTALMAASKPGDYAFSSPEAYFDELDLDGLPILDYDLQHHASGCYTSVMEIKQLNRLAEARLAAAEKYTLMAVSQGIQILEEPLGNAWRNALFGQFHDIMGGCSIREAYEDAKESFGESLSAAARVTNRALQAIAWRIDTSREGVERNSKQEFTLWEQNDQGVPVVVFNPHSWEASLPVRLAARVSAVTDGEGEAVPTQRVRSGVTNGTEDKWENIFLAAVPAMGWRVYWMYRKPRGADAVSPRTLIADPLSLENDWLRVRIHPRSGAIVELTDKRTGVNLIHGGTSIPVMDETHCDTWAHAVFSFRDEAGRFELIDTSLLESGGVLAAVRIRMRYNESTLEQRLTLYRDKPGLFIRYHIHWKERHRALKLSFPTGRRDATDVGSIPFGFLTRSANGKEQPMQQWAAIQKDGYGLAVVTDTRAAYDALDGELRVTALRSPIYADHFGERDDQCEFSQQGEQRFTLALMPYNDNPAEISRAAAETLYPVERIVGTYHKGNVPARFGLLTIDTPEVIADALKPAEDGGGLILRCHEAAGKASSARIALPSMGIAFDAAFRPQQVRSFRLLDGAAREVNLLEDDI
jgi:alpha-mannosidase